MQSNKNDDGFGGKNNNYIEYSSRGDRYKNLSPEEYLDLIRPYLRDLMNNHKPTEKINNNANNSDTERGKWKIQIIMQNNCISTRNFEDTRTIYSASKPVETFMGSDTNEAIGKLFNTLLQRFQQAIKTSIEK